MKDYLIILLIAVIGISCYSYSLGGKFIWDDAYFVLKNPAIRDIRNTQSFFTDPSTLAKGKLAFENYRPLTTLSYAINYMFSSINTFGYHLTNTILHIFNAILIFLLIKKLSKTEIACFTAMLFLVHPIQTEAVSWISGRSNVLFVFFYISAFILYIRSTGKDRLFYLLSLSVFCLALLSKEAAATLPLMICLYDVIVERKRPERSRVFRWLPYFVILIGYILLRYHMLGKFSQRPNWGGSIFETWLSIPKIIRIYTELIIVPVNLCVDRQMALVKSLLSMEFLFGLLVTVFFLGIFLVTYRRNKIVAFFTSWFLITLLPFLNIIPINILVAERFLYLPSIGIFFVFSASILKLAGKRRHLFYSIGILVLLVLSTLTIRRNLEWKDELTLYKSAVKAEPLNGRVRNILGVAYLNEGEIGLAERETRKAMELDKNSIYNYHNLSKIYFMQEKYEAAVDIIEEGLAIAPEDSGLLNLLAVIHLKNDRHSEAEIVLRKAIESDPGFINAYLNMGRLMEERGLYDDAIKFYRNTLKKFHTGHEKGVLWLRIAELCEKKNLNKMAEDIYNYVITTFPKEEVLRFIATEKLANMAD